VGLYVLPNTLCIAAFGNRNWCALAQQCVLQGCTDFPKSVRHLKIADSRSVTWCKFQAEDTNLGVTMYNWNAVANWRPQLVHPWPCYCSLWCWWLIFRNCGIFYETVLRTRIFREDVYEAVAMNVVIFRILIVELATWTTRKRGENRSCTFIRSLPREQVHRNRISDDRQYFMHVMNMTEGNKH
jgi:hypothetical protein